MVAERFIVELQVPSEMFVSVIVVLEVTPEMVTVAEPPIKVTVFDPEPVSYVTIASMRPVIVKTASSPSQIGPFALTAGSGIDAPPIIISWETKVSFPQSSVTL